MSVSESALRVVLTKALSAVVRLVSAASPVTMCEVPASSGMVGDASAVHQTAYGADHIEESQIWSEVEAVECVETRAPTIVESDECDSKNLIFSYLESCGDKFGSVPKQGHVAVAVDAEVDETALLIVAAEADETAVAMDAAAEVDETALLIVAAEVDETMAVDYLYK